MGIETLLQQIVSGLATGGIYASLALALVMIYQATEIVNFAQGEMAMFSTYLAWSMLNAGVPYWLAFLATVVLAFVGGLLIERIVIRPVEGKPILTLVIVCIGLLVILNSLAGWMFSYVIQPFPSPFPRTPFRIGNIVFGQHDLGVIAVTLRPALPPLRLFPLHDARARDARGRPEPRVEPALRHPCRLDARARLGLAALVGSVAGMLVAPVIFLEPNMMGGILIYAFAGATLGGITSPFGAVVGGFLVGVIENLAGTYIPFIGTELKLTVALLIIVGVLLLRPSGLFGHTIVRRV